MNPSDMRICLDVQAPHGAVELDAKQGDSQRRIFITLTDGGIPYRITEDCVPVFTAKKPDGTVLYNRCFVENNAAVYPLTRQTTACPGRVRCELRLYSGALQLDEQDKPVAGTDQLLTAAAFTLHVHPQVCSDTDLLTSQSESTWVEQLVSDTHTLITQVQTKLDSGEFVGAQGPQGEKGDKGDPGEVNIDDAAVSEASTWSSQRIGEFVEGQSAVVEITYDESPGTVTVNRTHSEITKLTDSGVQLRVQLFYMEVAGEETQLVNGKWMKRDQYGDAFVFCFDALGEFVLQNDNTAYMLPPPGNVRYDAAQELTAKQQAQARENIGALGETITKPVRMTNGDQDAVIFTSQTVSDQDDLLVNALALQGDHEGQIEDDAVILRGLHAGVEDNDAVNKKQLDDAIASVGWGAGKDYANALKGTASGGVVSLNDISPFEHEIPVNLSSETVTDFSNVKVRKYPSKNYAPYERVEFERADTTTFVFTEPLEVGKTYRFTADVTSTFDRSCVVTAVPSGQQTWIKQGTGTTFVFTVPNAGCTGFQLFAATTWGETLGHTAIYDRISVIEECVPTEHIPTVDGVVNGISGNGEPITLITENPEVTITAEYNKDTNKVIESLVQAIIGLGGNV